MPLAQTIIDQIRTEIGYDNDVSDEAETPPAEFGDLETIYTDTEQGNYSTLRTALIVWKKRLADFQSRAFDATSGGSLFARNQRGKFLARRVKELELVVDYTLTGFNDEVTPENTSDDDSEFS